MCVQVSQAEHPTVLSRQGKNLCAFLFAPLILLVNSQLAPVLRKAQVCLRCMWALSSSTVTPRAHASTGGCTAASRALGCSTCSVLSWVTGAAPAALHSSGTMGSAATLCHRGGTDHGCRAPAKPTETAAERIGTRWFSVAHQQPEKVPK